MRRRLCPITVKTSPALAALCALLALALSLCAASSCSVHEWPEAGLPARLRLEFRFSEDLPPYLDVDWAAGTRGGSPEDHCVRYSVRFYAGLPGGGYAEEDARELRLVLTKDDVSSLDWSAEVSLPEGRWKVRCWADYAGRGSSADLYYGTEDFRSVTVPEGRAGCTDFADAFAGSAEVDLRRRGSREESASAVLEMGRPLAKFRFIATDLRQLETKVLRERAERRGASDAQDAPPTRGFDPADYSIAFHYTSFLPCAFDLFSDRPVDSRSGAGFEGEFTPLSEGEALLGFDYVLVNGATSSVQVQVELRERASGELLSLTPPIEVPLSRSRVTTVRGDFLTMGAGGGLGVDPDFDDDYNLFL